MPKHAKKMALVASLVILLLLISVPAAFASGGTHHTVHYGETLFSIGRTYDVNPYAIAEVNNLANPHHIYAGQVLYIPTYQYYDDCYYGCDWYPDGQHESNYHDSYYTDGRYNDGRYNDGRYNDGRYNDGYYNDYHHGSDYGYSGPGYHQVVAGETLSSIAYHYGVSLWAVASANRLPNPNCIYVGQVLAIPMQGPAYGYY